MLFQNKEGFKIQYQNLLDTVYGKSLEEASDIEKFIILETLIRSRSSVNWRKTKQRVKKQEAKEMHYFSLEFLLGRMLRNNLMNLDAYDLVKEGLKDLDVDLEKLLELEDDPGLGNGGLGRLAACFMDSLASSDYPAVGNTIRYKFGLFKQVIVNNEQVEVPDQWMRLGNQWEVCRHDKAVDVNFYGSVNVTADEKGDLHFERVNCETVRAVPYEMPMIGSHTETTNTLRMWSPEPSFDLGPDVDFREYLAHVDDICRNVYPDDSTVAGKYLRIKQEYFFVSAGLQFIVRKHMKQYGTLDNFAEKHVIQLNDTHPALAIPELMRLMMDEYGYSWAKAAPICRETFAYTNHTVMAEALERWPVEYIKKLLPRIYMIIEEIDRQFAMDVYRKGYNKDFLNQVAIIGRNNIRMANLCVVGSFSVNGVAKLHTEILKDDLFKHYYKLFPEKFNNKTNGITPRRWMLYSNPELAGFVSKTISADLSSDFNSISDLADYANDPEVQKRFLEVKRHNKENFAEYVKEHYGFTVDPNSIYDVIAKRLHAYKRQLLDIFYVIHLYLRLKEDPNFTVPKTTFFFAAKAASSYTFAKEVIKLINCVAETIRNDADVCDKLQVVFLPNYCVTLSEHLVPAAEISEQISLAGKEASGTGNMKFMMNGAITLGTLDGANVEIREEVGDDNIVIFGLRTDEVNNLRRVYRCRDYYENDDRLRRIIYSLMNGTFTKEANAFKNITDEFLVRNDEYFVFADFDAYVKAHEKIYEIMQQPELYAKMALINIAKSAYFSSDRTIEDYVRDIWHLKKL